MNRITGLKAISDPTSSTTPGAVEVVLDDVESPPPLHAKRVSVKTAGRIWFIKCLALIEYYKAIRDYICQIRFHVDT